MKQQKKQIPRKTTPIKPTARERKSNHTQSSASATQNIIILMIVIAVFSFGSYLSKFDNELTNWDDAGYVTENEAVRDVSFSKLKNFFVRTNEEGKTELAYEMGNFHPLAMISLAIDYKLADKTPSLKSDEGPKIDPFVFHLHNILLHLANTILVFWVVYLLVGYTGISGNYIGLSADAFVAFVASLLFGVHTMHVESVAWTAERKDVLYTFYFLVSLLLYIRYLMTEKKLFLIFSIVAFLFSLLAKGQAVSLAVTLIAVDLLLRRSYKKMTVILEKLPYFILALIFGVIAILAQQHGDAIHDIDEYPFYQRLVFASYALVQYFLKLFVPINLAAIYPYPRLIGTDLPGELLMYPLPALGILAALYFTLKSNKWIAFGLWFFMINIFLLLQLLPVGSAVMADRYTYIPSIGFFIIVAFTIKWLIDKFLSLKMVVIGVFTVYVLFLSFRTYSQTKVWKTSESLWSHTLSIEPTALVGWNNWGSAVEKTGDKKTAIDYFTKAIELKPDYAHAIYNRGTAKKDMAGLDSVPQRGQEIYKDAIKDFDMALKINSQFPEAYHNRGICKENMGLLDSAIADYSKGLAIKPTMYKLWSSRGVAKGKSERLDDAIEDFNESIKLQPFNPEAYSNRGFAKVKQGKMKEAIVDYDYALSLNPQSKEALYNRGIALYNLKDTLKALKDIEVLISVDPNHADAYSFRGQIRTAKGDYKGALDDYDKLMKLRPFSLETLYARGIVYYKSKSYQMAVADFNILVQNAPNFGMTYYYRGLSYIENNQKPQGCLDLRKAQSLNIVQAGTEISKYCR